MRKIKREEYVKIKRYIEVNNVNIEEFVTAYLIEQIRKVRTYKNNIKQISKEDIRN